MLTQTHTRRYARAASTVSQLTYAEGDDAGLESAGSELQQFSQHIIHAGREQIQKLQGATSFGRSVAAFLPDLSSDAFTDLVRDYRRVLLLGARNSLQGVAETAEPIGATVSGAMPVVSADARTFVPVAASMLKNKKLQDDYTLSELRSDASAKTIRDVQKLQRAVGLTPLPGATLRGHHGPASTVLMRDASGRLVGSATTLGIADVGQRYDDVAFLVGVSIHPDVQGKGLGSRLTAATMLAAWRSLAADRVMAVVDPDNHVALRTNARFGMVPAPHQAALYVEFASNA